MYYEINVAKQNAKGEYIHYFATAKRSITDKEKLKVVATDIVSKFPAPKYKITVSYSPEISTGMGVEDFLLDPDKLTL